MFNRLLILTILSIICSVIITTNVLYADTMTVEKPVRKVKPITIGWVERVKTIPLGLELEAKISPSFSQSSLHAEDIKLITKKGQPHYRFELEDRHGVKKTLEYPATAQGSTKKDSKSAKKVVTLPICIAGKRHDIDVHLTDRSSLEQEIRIGRNDIAGHYLIDPSRTHTTVADCKEIQ